MTEHVARSVRPLVALATACLTMLAVVAALGMAATPARASTDCPWVGSSTSPDARAGQVLAQMTLDEKITMLGLTGSPERYENYFPAIPRLCIPHFTLQDGPAGVAGNFTGVTQLPAPIDAAASFDPSVAAAYGNIQGTESWGKGIDVAQGPDVNIARVPENGRTFEAYGEDPYLVSQIGVANIKGIQNAGVMADVKHLAGNNQEKNRDTINDVVSERTLREIYLPAFEASVKDANVATAMCAYNKVNGVYSCQNSFLMQDLFKNEYQFGGFIRSDFGAVHDVAASYNAGMDQSKPEHNAELKAAVQAGQVPVSRVDAAVTRVLREMFRFNLFDHQPTGTPDSTVTSATHAATARDIAEQGTVLLKNAGGALPLNTSKVKSIAVIGPDGGDQAYTSGGGSSQVKAPYVVTPYQGIKDRAGRNVNVTYTPGTSPALPSVPSSALTPPSQYAEAKQAAKSADVAIVFANDVEGEGHDRPDLSLPDNQDGLISAVAGANPNTIVVLNTGSAVTMPWLGQVKGVVEGWYAGQEDGNAVAAVLFGDVNPSGKLPLTFPKSDADTPAHTAAQWPGVTGNSYYSEGLQVGYRWYDAQNITPLFPFGYGLSYTSFRVSHLVVAPKQLGPNGRETVTVDVTNTGGRPGAEVVQLYIGLPSSTGEPPKQLKGFEKISLKPRETRQVTFRLTPRDPAYWDSNAHDWVTAGGDYQVMVGTSSRDIALQRSFRVAKTTDHAATRPFTVPAGSGGQAVASSASSGGELAVLGLGAVAGLGLAGFGIRRFARR